MSTTYGQLYLRRGADSTRTGFTFEPGEPFWTTDLEELWVGDGTTAGGIFSGSGWLSQVGADVSPSAVATLSIQPSRRFSQYLQRVLSGAGSGAFTYTVKLARLTALPGALARVYVELPASANPTVQVEDYQGSVVLDTITSPNPAQATYYCGVYAMGADGAWHKINGNWLD